MKAQILLVVAVLLLCTVCAPVVAAESDVYVRIVVPAAHISTFIQPVHQLPDGSWPEPSHVTAWYTVPDSDEIYLHEVGLGAELYRLRPGDLAYLYEGWDAEPIQLRVIGETETVGADELDEVLGRAGRGMFAIITCQGLDRRLIVWARVDYGPRWAFVGWGDCLGRIAKRYGTTVEEIIRANGVEDPNYIRAGTLLQIPETTNQLDGKVVWIF